MDEAVRPDVNPESLSEEHVSLLWDEFRAGRAVACPRGDDVMAVAVDASTGTYRFVCVHCGHSTPWFDSKAGVGLRLRGQSSSPPPGNGLRDL